jgi:hypothetical protein
MIKKAYEKEITHAQVVEKFGKYRGFLNKRTHCEIGTANVVFPEIKKEMLVRTHLCSAKRHLWFLKSKEIQIKSIHDKVTNNQCEKYVLCPINENSSTQN